MGCLSEIVSGMSLCIKYREILFIFIFSENKFNMNTSKSGIIGDGDHDLFSINRNKPTVLKHQLCGILMLSDHSYKCKNKHDKENPYVGSSPTPIPNFGNTCWLGLRILKHYCMLKSQ